MKIPPHIRWPAVIFGALVIHVVALLATVWVATSNPSYAVEEDYYQKALDWDSKRAQDRHNAELGWQVGINVVPPSAAGDPAAIVLFLRDPAGGPIDDADVMVETFHNARADEIFRAALSARSDGRYSAAVPMRRSGVWEFRITATQGDDTFTHTETRYVTLTRSPRN